MNLWPFIFVAVGVGAGCLLTLSVLLILRMLMKAGTNPYLREEPLPPSKEAIPKGSLTMWDD